MKPYEQMTRAELMVEVQKLGYSATYVAQAAPPYLLQILRCGVPAASGPTAPAQPAVPSKPSQPVAAGITVNVDDAIAQRLTDVVAPRTLAACRPSITRTAHDVARATAAAYAREQLVQFIVPTRPTEPITVNLGLTHAKIGEVIDNVQLDIPVYVFGPAGSGKTTLAEQMVLMLAQTLNRPDYKLCPKSFCPTTQLHELIGFVDAQGITHRTELMDAWQYGHFYFGDEADRCPAVNIYLNAGIANGWIVFPGIGLVKKHPDCRIMTAGNTCGLGATVEYVGAERQDAAVLDRFAFVAIDYDEKMELAMAGIDQSAWVKHVQKLRKGLRSLGASAPDCRITPRASLFGAKRLRANPNADWAQLEAQFIWKGIEDDDIVKIKAAARAAV